MAHEERECRWCYGEGRFLDATEPGRVPVWRGCVDCGGTGTVTVFMYERVAPNLGRRDEAEVLWLSWHGTAREMKAAHKELAKRNGGRA